MKTRKSLVAEINSILSEGNTDCRMTGECLKSAINRLRFHKATVYEPRGLSDCRLPLATWHAVLQHRLPFDFSGEVINFLDV